MEIFKQPLTTSNLEKSLPRIKTPMRGRDRRRRAILKIKNPRLAFDIKSKANKNFDFSSKNFQRIMSIMKTRMNKKIYNTHSI